jgi:hypothetical protein
MLDLLLHRWKIETIDLPIFPLPLKHIPMSSDCAVYPNLCAALRVYTRTRRCLFLSRPEIELALLIRKRWIQMGYP